MNVKVRPYGYNGYSYIFSFTFIKIDIKNVFVYFNKYYLLPVEINGLMGLLLLMIYSLFDGKVDVILIANKNKTSYDALSVVVLFISSASISNMFLFADLVFSNKLSLFIIESSVNVNISLISL